MLNKTSDAMERTISQYSRAIICLYHSYKTPEVPDTDVTGAEPAENTPGTSCDQIEAPAN